MMRNKEQNDIITQLSNIFPQKSVEQIEEICQRCEWIVDNCVEQIMWENTDNDENNKQTDNEMQGSSSRNNNNNVLGIGAIPKSTNSSNSQKLTLVNKLNNNNVKPMNNENASSCSSNNKNNNNGCRIYSPKNENNKYNSKVGLSTNEQRICDNIAAGLKVVIIMRGVPGSGKSYLARSLVESAGLLQNGLYNTTDFVLSTDDYFYDTRGCYRYASDRLDLAHNWNQRRFEEKAKLGWSPLFVDNTNLLCWEMFPYVKIAVKNGYMLELLEPRTPWHNSPSQLALKNIHRVPRDRIQHMLNKFEIVTVKNLMQISSCTKYEMAMPQMRNLPPLPLSTQQQQSGAEATDTELQILQQKIFDNADGNILTVLENFTLADKAYDDVAKRLHMTQSSLEKASKSKETSPPIVLPNPPNCWTAQPKAQRSNTNRFISKVAESAFPPLSSATPAKRDNSPNTNSLLNLLKDSQPTNTDNINAVQQPFTSPFVLNRHKVNCVNESKSFATLRQIYPNRQLNALWDLFVKCNGDIDWVIDLLLHEEDNGLQISNTHEQEMNWLTCNCDKHHTNGAGITSVGSDTNKSNNENTNNNIVARPQRQQRLRSPRISKPPLNNELQVVKETIEQCFVLGNEYYSPHVRKVRDIRAGVAPRTDAETQTQVALLMPSEFDNEGEQNDMIKLELDASLLQQLRQIFKEETQLIVSTELPKDTPSNISVPRVLAKELYLIWLEAALNSSEEQRLKTLEEDTEFARLLANPKYENFSESPNNLRELLEMEEAWNKYKTNRKTLQQLCQPSINISMHLTKLKLCEEFPHIPEDTLLDIMAAHDNSYAATVQVLREESINAVQPNLTCSQLLERARLEQDRLKKKTDNRSIAIHSEEATSNIVSKSMPTPDEMRILALRNFEENRNLASHHCQLKGECYRKAQEAVQLGNCSVASYYSEIAALHRSRVETYNNRAASSMVTVHKYSKDYNDEILDLHYLFVLEAVACLDIFLDRHIAGLRIRKQSYKHVFIITGRGLHSLGGVSTVKKRVRSRLKERYLRWIEVNPGLLKVKLFPDYNLTKEL